MLSLINEKLQAGSSVGSTPILAILSTTARYTPCEMEDLGLPEGVPEDQYDTFIKLLIDSWWAKFDQDMSDEEWE
jgi:hypothetical protein